jgi:LmbE family N-acetylglucosaminyl deacetylase
VLSLVPAVIGGIHLLCLGAHPDDIEIGAGGTILQLAGAGSVRAATWVVFSGTPERVAEGTASANAFLDGVMDRTVAFHDVRDGYFPANYGLLKEAFEALKASASPDLVLMPRADDAHQDHRLVAELARTTFRDHVLLEYEIAKFDADLRPPNAYVALDEAILARKIELIGAAFGSQHGRTWFDPEAFRGLARIRGIEAGGGVRYAEAFHAHKLLLGVRRPNSGPSELAEGDAPAAPGGR